jgi:hypothetical protein
VLSRVPFSSLEVRPFAKPGFVLGLDARVLPIPEGWALLPPGDAALSRRIKEDGPSYTVVEMKGRKRFSQGIWAPAERIAALRAQLGIERSDPSYQRKLDAGRRRRDAEQKEYEGDFQNAVLGFLSFHPRYAELAARMAAHISAHAVPVGSGTVARTERIPIEERAEAATIAWMRHQTTAYDNMTIPRVKGMRREVRRMLAQRSKQLLESYRNGEERDPLLCPLWKALNVPSESTPANHSEELA